MSSDPKPNRFTFRAPDLPDDRTRLGDAEAAFNQEADPTQDRERQASPATEPQHQRFTANGMPEPTPMGTRTMRRFRFNEQDDEPEKKQADEIDFSSGEWVIEFTPEDSQQPLGGRAAKHDIDHDR